LGVEYLEPRLALSAVSVPAPVPDIHMLLAPALPAPIRADSLPGAIGARPEFVPHFAAGLDTVARLPAETAAAAPVYGAGDVSLLPMLPDPASYQLSSAPAGNILPDVAPSGAVLAVGVPLLPAAASLLPSPIEHFDTAGIVVSHAGEGFFSAWSASAGDVRIGWPPGGGVLTVSLPLVPVSVDAPWSSWRPPDADLLVEGHAGADPFPVSSVPVGFTVSASPSAGLVVTVSTVANATPTNMATVTPTASQQSGSGSLLPVAAAARNAGQNLNLSPATADNSSKPSGPAAPSYPAASASAAEGGFVEIRSVSPALPPSVGRDVNGSAPNSAQPAEGPSPLDIGPARVRDEGNSSQGTQPVGESGAQDGPPAAPGGLASGGSQDSAPCPAAEEGGMIVLAAPAFPPADAAQVAVASALPPGGVPSADGHCQRVDKVMAQFQAFEVAGGPLERPDAAEAPAAETRIEGAQAAPARPVRAQGAAKTSAADGITWREQLLHSRGALPALGAAALLTRNGRARGRWLLRRAARLLGGR
jgi:hypothetical protein